MSLVHHLPRPFAAALGLALAVLPAAAEDWPTPHPECYWHDSSVGYRLPRWMGGLADATRLDAISMVGTHDSGSRFGGDAVATQTLDIPAQLNMGVRVLDLRFKHKGNGLFVYHGIVDQRLGAREAVGQVVAFLKANPSETVLIRIKEEDHGARNTNSFEEAFLDQVWNPYQGSFWTGAAMPSLGQVRGRIVILNSFPSRKTYGLWYASADIQDDYKVQTNWDLHDKWLKVKAHLEKAAATGPGQRMFLNYLSASGGSFPYFVVSGKSSPGTGAPRLATGLTTPGWNRKYPDFPRVNCFMGICTIAFEGTNILSVENIRRLNREREVEAARTRKPVARAFVGILMTDFPGPMLVHTVTRQNTFAN